MKKDATEGEDKEWKQGMKRVAMGDKEGKGDNGWNKARTRRVVGKQGKF